MVKSYEQIFFAANAGGDDDGNYSVDLLIYYTFGNENNVATYDFLAFGKNYSAGIEDDVTQAIKEREHFDVSFTGAKRIHVLTQSKRLMHAVFNK